MPTDPRPTWSTLARLTEADAPDGDGPAPPRRPLRRPRPSWGRRLGVTVGLTLLAVLLILAGYVLFLLPKLPEPGRVQHPDLAQTSIAYTADGTELARYYLHNRIWVTHDALSPHVTAALVATEDRRFFEHRGVDVQRLLGAVLHTARGDRQGGSTITMQLVRNLYDAEIGRAVTVRRKLREALMAVKVEQAYGKERILETYLNTVAFGYNAFGIEAAARTFFNTSADALNPAEAATLIGMLKGPSAYNPLRHPEAARQRRNTVLRLMAEQRYITWEAYRHHRAAPLGLDFQTPTVATSLAPYFAEYVRHWVDDWARAHGYNLYTDGLRIHTSLDSDLQRAAQAAVQAQLPGLQAVAAYEWSRPTPPVLATTTAPYVQRAGRGYTAPFAHYWAAEPNREAVLIRRTTRYRRAVTDGEPPDLALARLREDGPFVDSLRTAHTRLEVGLVAMEPGTGAVRAWVGGRDFGRDQYDHVALARRQPGSTFKPFVYAAALDLGYSPYFTLLDSALTFDVPGSRRGWRPTNAGGGYSGRYLTLRDGLVYSKNTITAQLTEAVSPYEVARMAGALGIATELPRILSLGLGTVEVTLLELAHAYTSLAALGQRTEPLVVTRIEDRSGRVLAEFAPQPRQMTDPHTAYTTIDLLRGVVDQGTGTWVRSRFGLTGDLAGKTGTTQDNVDGWFMLMHPELVAGAWVGFNDPSLAFRTSYWGQGGHNALTVVGAFMQQAERQGLVDAGARFTPPPGYRPPRRPPPPDTTAETVATPTERVRTERNIAW